MFRKKIIYLLVVSLLNLIGCYSYSALSEEEMKNDFSFPDEAYRLVLESGSEIFYQPNKSISLDPAKWEKTKKTILIRINEPSDLIVGSGMVINRRTNRESIYRGIIKRENIDSTETTVVNNENYEVFWLKDSTKILFKIDDYFSITPEDGTGYWIKGREVENPLINYSHEFKGKIELSDVKEIEKQTYLVGATVAMSIVGFGLMALVWAFSPKSR